MVPELLELNGLGPDNGMAMCIDFNVYTFYYRYTKPIEIATKVTMRTNIEIDDKLMNDALKLTGLKTKKDAVELGLRTLVRLQKQAEIKKYRGKLKWEGDLDDMRNA